MKPTTPQQIEATIAIVRAAAAGDPLDDSHTLRGHLAMVLSALDDARRERDKARQHARAAERDAVEAETRCAALIAERDEARAALAGEPARIAVAEMARDVAWVRKVARSVDRTPAIEAIARALDLSPLGGVKVYMADQSDADIAAAIRAVRGAS